MRLDLGGWQGRTAGVRLGPFDIVKRLFPGALAMRGRAGPDQLDHIAQVAGGSRDSLPSISIVPSTSGADVDRVPAPLAGTTAAKAPRKPAGIGRFSRRRTGMAPAPPSGEV